MISIYYDYDPLLNDVGVKWVLLVMNETFLQISKGLQSQIFQVVVYADNLLEKHEKLSVSFWLEIFESLKYKFAQNC